MISAIHPRAEKPVVIITGHQPNYMPYPGFFQKAMLSEAFVIVDNVQFVKRGPFGWIHRNRIRTASEKGWDWLTVPVLTKGKFEQSIMDTRINNAVKWRRKHLKALELNYVKAPFYAKYYGLIERILGDEWDSLCELGVTIILELFRELEIDVPVHKTSELESTGKGAELIVDFCRRLGADAYISGVHGKDYLDESLFEENGVRLAYQDYSPEPYPQQFPGDFVPNLSIIDMLMNIGPDRTREILLQEAA